MTQLLFIIYRPGARGIRRNIARSDDIITEGNVSTNPPSGGSINDIIPKVKETTKFRINFKTILKANTIFNFLCISVFLTFSL
jgi:hypothetical protein